MTVCDLIRHVRGFLSQFGAFATRKGSGVLRAVKKTAPLLNNCILHINIANSSLRPLPLHCVALCGQRCCLPHHIPGKFHRPWQGFGRESCAICQCFQCLSMHLPSSKPILILVVFPCLAWRGISYFNISQGCVYLSERVKRAIVLGLHLTQSPM